MFFSVERKKEWFRGMVMLRII